MIEPRVYLLDLYKDEYAPEDSLTLCNSTCYSCGFFYQRPSLAMGLLSATKWNCLYVYNQYLRQLTTR